MGAIQQSINQALQTGGTIAAIGTHITQEKKAEEQRAAEAAIKEQRRVKAEERRAAAAEKQAAYQHTRDLSTLVGEAEGLKVKDRQYQEGLTKESELAEAAELAASRAENLIPEKEYWDAPIPIGMDETGRVIYGEETEPELTYAGTKILEAKKSAESALEARRQSNIWKKEALQRQTALVQGKQATYERFGMFSPEERSLYDISDIRTRYAQDTLAQPSSEKEVLKKAQEETKNG